MLQDVIKAMKLKMICILKEKSYDNLFLIVKTDITYNKVI